MNFETINTPSDLVEENNQTLSPMEKAVLALCDDDLTPADHLMIAKGLIKQVHQFHEHVITKKQGECSPQWLVDCQTLLFTIKMLETVEF